MNRAVLAAIRRLLTGRHAIGLAVVVDGDRHFPQPWL